MRLLINFAPLKSGGGQSVGLNFIHGLDVEKYPDIDFFFAVAKGSKIEKELIKRGIQQMISLPNYAVGRILKELTEESRYIDDNHIDAIYSCFGYALVRQKICQVSGVADSNLFYPEVEFWEGSNGLERLKKWFIDQYRKWGYSRANGLIFENADMEARAKKLFGDHCNSIYIKPSYIPVDSSEKDEIDIPLVQNRRKGLFFCGWQRNKGILLIPEIAKFAMELNFYIDFYMSVKVEENNNICREFIKRMKKFQVSKYIHFLGRIDKTQIGNLYRKIDYVFLLSKLESFSNNIIEAWYYEKPLIAADEEWAHGVCHDAALYVDRSSGENIVKKIIEAERNGSMRKIVGHGRSELKEYPMIEEKIKKELAYVKHIYRMGSL